MYLLTVFATQHDVTLCKEAALLHPIPVKAAKVYGGRYVFIILTDYNTYTISR